MWKGKTLSSEPTAITIIKGAMTTAMGPQNQAAYSLSWKQTSRSLDPQISDPPFILPAVRNSAQATHTVLGSDRHTVRTPPEEEGAPPEEEEGAPLEKPHPFWSETFQGSRHLLTSPQGKFTKHLEEQL